jgi:hypothetical protein
MSPIHEHRAGSRDGQRDAAEAVLRHHWLRASRLVLVVLGFALFAGYTVGKDMARRDNARDAALLERAGNR